MGIKIIGKTQKGAAEPTKATPKAKRRYNPTRRAYPAKVFERLFEFVAAGEDLTAACNRSGMPTVWTVRRRLAVDDYLNDRYQAAQKIRLHGEVDKLLRLPDEALAGLTKVSAADRLTAAKQKADSIKWIASKLLDEFQGLEDGGGTVTLNIIGSPDAAPAPAGTPQKPLDPVRADSLPPGDRRDNVQSRLRTGTPPQRQQTQTQKPRVRRTPYDAGTVQRVRELFGLGRTYKSIVEETGISLSTIQKMRDHVYPYRA